ncbi:MAG: AMP-binding protein, partial [Pseudomonadota bacterium]
MRNKLNVATEIARAADGSGSGQGRATGLKMEGPELAKGRANFEPLTPVSYLRRAAEIFGPRTAIVHGERRISYTEFYDRARQFADALQQAGVKRGDTVAIIAANGPALLEAHYAVPMLGAVLNPINVRLDAASIAFCLTHGEAQVFLVDREFAAAAGEAIESVEHELLVIDIADAATADRPGV